MDVLHGDDLSQFIQAVHILDLIQELHTVVEKIFKKSSQSKNAKYSEFYYF